MNTISNIAPNGVKIMGYLVMLNDRFIKGFFLCFMAAAGITERTALKIWRQILEIYFQYIIYGLFELKYMVHPKFSFGVNMEIIRNNDVLFSYRSFYTRVKNVNLAVKLAPFDRSYDGNGWLLSVKSDSIMNPCLALYIFVSKYRALTTDS